MKNERNTKQLIKTSNGITLIALVITIIVLLILAAVSVVTLTGENGILRQAGNAKEETRGASVEEARDLWKINQEADNYTENRIAQTLSGLLDDLKNQKLITEEERKTIDATGKVTIGSRTIVFEETLAEKIVPTNYGDYINYNVDLNEDGDITNDWRIFYDDGKNVFIIAADYLPNTKLPPATDMGTYINYPYSAYWPSTNNLTRAGSSAISEIVASKYMLSWRNTYPESTNNNIKAVAALLDTSAWSSFATGVNGAEAVGGATLEMFVASWNKKGYTTLYCNNSTNLGYYIGINDTPTNTYVYVGGDEGYVDSLYFPQTKSVNNCQAYWLASPNGDNSNRLMTIYYGGYIHSTRRFGTSVTMIPIVGYVR